MDRLKRLTIGLAVLGACAIAPGIALGADATVTGTVTGGSLSLTTSAAPSFSATLDGSDQTKTFTIPSVLTDARGSGAGWNTTITSTEYSSGSHTLATDASTLTSLASVCQSGGTCTDETNSVSLPVSVPAGPLAPTPVKYHNAEADSGMGVFDHTPTISVALPANTYAGTYSSTITLASVSGP